MSLSPKLAALFDLAGRRALITGASGAFGASAARALAGAGASVCLAGAKEDELRAVVSTIEAEGGEASIVVCRPDSEASVSKMLAAAGGAPDIVVVASGFSTVKPAADISPAEFDAVIDANVRQTWLVTRGAGAAMQAAGKGGAVLLVSSVRARHASPAGTTAYSASKAAVDMLVRSFATEWGPKNIRVNAIAPTIFRSALTEWLFEPAGEERRNRTLARIPLGRLAEPDDFAGSVVFLCSEASAYVTGEILHVDGGFAAN